MFSSAVRRLTIAVLLILSVIEIHAASLNKSSFGSEASRWMFDPGLAPVLQEKGADTSIRPVRLALVGGAFAASIAVIHFYQQNGWWKDNRAPFHFHEDLVYGLSVDKIGHFYGSYLLQYVISGCLRWANVSEQSSLWIGSAGGLLFQTYVEIEDGFSSWGFDRVDFASDVAGAAWPICRYYVPYLRNLDLKLWYHPSSLLGSTGGSGFKGQKHLVIDDYEGQTFWLSVKVHNIVPESIRSYCPAFLCLALGYGARDIAKRSPYPVYYLAFDYDMTQIIPNDTVVLRTIGQLLNFIHLPSPAIRISPSVVWYGILL